jgi:hypothetical protein
MLAGVPTPMEIEQTAPLKNWAEAAEREIRQITAEIAPLQERLAAAKERLDLIHRLMKLMEKTPPTSALNVQPLERTTPRQTNNNDIEGQIEHVLKEAGGPMHVTNIRQSLIDRGVPLPGRGDEANIILRMRRCEERFARTGRGVYALKSWGLPEVDRSRKTRKRQTRGSRAS